MNNYGWGKKKQLSDHRKFLSTLCIISHVINNKRSRSIHDTHYPKITNVTPIIPRYLPTTTTTFHHFFQRTKRSENVTLTNPLPEYIQSFLPSTKHTSDLSKICITNQYSINLTSIIHTSPILHTAPINTTKSIIYSYWKPTNKFCRFPIFFRQNLKCHRHLSFEIFETNKKVYGVTMKPQ